MDDKQSNGTEMIELATDLTVAWLNNPNNRVSPDDVPTFLQKMHSTLTGLAGTQGGGEAQDETQSDFTPAVSVRKSTASRDHIISMIDGKPYRTLRRHLSTHGLTPEQYRERYGLKSDYPMVAPNYSEARRSMAKRLGLGRKPKSADQAPAAGSPDTPPRAPRKKPE